MALCMYGIAISTRGRNAAAKEFFRVRELAFSPSIADLKAPTSLYRFPNPSFIPDIMALNALLIWLKIRRDSARLLNLAPSAPNELFDLCADLVRLENTLFTNPPNLFNPDPALLIAECAMENAFLAACPSLL